MSIMCNETKFTIVIPTRERRDTLVHTIASALAQDYGNYEILVSDNASEDNTSNLVASLNDGRIRYVNTGYRVSMSHNWEFALNHVEDGWVTFLGDDDAILPGALVSADRIIKETGVLALRSNGCEYYWPSLLNSRHGVLSINLDKGYRRVRSGEALAKVMKGKLPYNRLPMLYNGGFIHTSLIKKAKTITGNFFLSMTPDVYSAMVFSLLTDEYVYTDEPLAINGASHHSGGTAAFETEKKSRSYDPAAKFWSEGNIPFHDHLPLLASGIPVRSIAAIVYEAYLQAKPLHHFKQLVVSPEQQLDLILKTAAPHTAEVIEWGKSFAEKHQLDYAKVTRNNFSVIISLIQECADYLPKINRRISPYTVRGSCRMPMVNVYEASVVAGFLRENSPSIPKKILNIINNLIVLFRSINLKSLIRRFER